MKVIITYDVPSRHSDLKKALFEKGYKDEIPDTTGACKSGLIYCPNTTLFHQDKTPSAARKDTTDACESLGIELERFVATQWGPNWAAVCGEPFK